MSDASIKIGVIDSGVGGMTVVREIDRLLPDADIIYFGDSANVPYGNKTEREIIDLTCAMLDFMREKGVILVAVACNTISTLIEKLKNRYTFPVFSIIEPAAAFVAASAASHVGLLATEFTVRSGHYQRLIHERNSSIVVHAKGSKTLAALIEAPDYDEAAADAEIANLLSALALEYPLKEIILGCTHYPIAMKLFNKRAPDIQFIDPAALQASEVLHVLEERGYFPTRRMGTLTIYTSGGSAGFKRILGQLDIGMPWRISAQGE